MHLARDRFQNHRRPTRGHHPKEEREGNMHHGTKLPRFNPDGDRRRRRADVDDGGIPSDNCELQVGEPPPEKDHVQQRQEELNNP